MKVLNRMILSSLLVVSISMVACSQKEDKKTKVSSAGRPVDGVTSTLQQQQQALGTEIEILGISKATAQQGYELRTQIRVGSISKTVGIFHAPGRYQTEYVPGSTPVGPIQVTAESYCADETCNYYVIMLGAQQNGYLLYQLGVFKEFSTGLTLYKIQPGDNPISFDNMFDILVRSYENY